MDLPTSTGSLPTPALLVERQAFDANLATMAAMRPGLALRPHVKATKSTGLARRQVALGHTAFCCATIREVEGMAAAGLGDDLLLANEVADARRLGAVVDGGARVTLAVDSEATIAAAASGGVREVLIDVNVGLPRCGCDPTEAGRLADVARAAGLEVRGVMGYEGHVQHVVDRAEREAGTEAAMALLARAHLDVGGDVVSGGGTGTFDCNTVCTELQAGSYSLMDGDYDRLGLPFVQALFVEATVISVQPKWAVADCGLKALGMDSGDPAIDGAKVWFCSDEHVVFAGLDVAVGERIRVRPRHVDPTVAYHEALWVVEGDEIVDRWAIDLRGW